MKKYWVVGVLTVALVPSYAQDYYKCKTKTGVVYQQIPCDAGPLTVGDVMRGRAAERKAESERQQQEAEANRIAAESRKKKLDSICGKGERGGNVEVGMTEEYFRNCTFQGGSIILTSHCAHALTLYAHIS